MLLVDHFLRIAGVFCQFWEFLGEVGFWGKQGRAVWGAVADVYLTIIRGDKQMNLVGI